MSRRNITTLRSQSANVSMPFFEIRRVSEILTFIDPARFFPPIRPVHRRSRCAYPAKDVRLQSRPAANVAPLPVSDSGLSQAELRSMLREFPRETPAVPSAAAFHNELRALFSRKRFRTSEQIEKDRTTLALSFSLKLWSTSR